MLLDNWVIEYEPQPDGRNWCFHHKDFDGAPDSGDFRYGAEPTYVDAVEAILVMEEEEEVAQVARLATFKEVHS